MNFDKLIAIFDADWDESKHPRAKNGQFGKKGSGGSTSTSKESKKSTMSKSYKALSPSQKADAKSHVASQIKSMSKEKQISVANRVLKAQGKEPIVANKDGTYTWTNKGERVTTQKPPRIKSDKLARAIVSNGYAVPGIKTGVSAETAKASATKAPEAPKSEGGITSEQLAAVRRLSSKMNGGKSATISHKDFINTPLTPKKRKLLEHNLGYAEDNLYNRAHDEGWRMKRSDIYQVATLVKQGLRSTTSNTDTLNKIIGVIRMFPKKGAMNGDIADKLIKELYKIS